MLPKAEEAVAFVSAGDERSNRIPDPREEIAVEKASYPSNPPNPSLDALWLKTPIWVRLELQASSEGRWGRLA